VQGERARGEGRQLVCVGPQAVLQGQHDQLVHERGDGRVVLRQRGPEAPAERDEVRDAQRLNDMSETESVRGEFVGQSIDRFLPARAGLVTNRGEALGSERGGDVGAVPYLLVEALLGLLDQTWRQTSRGRR
jgi:hypothetical protein